MAERSKGEPAQRYAIVVVLETTSAEAAWEAVRSAAGVFEDGGEPDCIHIGAPWQGIPAEAGDLSTDHLELGMSVPNGSGYVPLTVVLTPCE